jgi:hypothetical protein
LPEIRRIPPFPKLKAPGLPPIPSNIAYSAINQEFAAHGESRFIGSKKDDCLGDLARISKAPGRDTALNGSGHGFEIGFRKSKLAIKGC